MANPDRPEKANKRRNNPPAVAKWITVAIVVPICVALIALVPPWVNSTTHDPILPEGFQRAYFKTDTVITSIYNSPNTDTFDRLSLDFKKQSYSDILSLVDPGFIEDQSLMFGNTRGQTPTEQMAERATLSLFIDIMNPRFSSEKLQNITSVQYYALVKPAGSNCAQPNNAQPNNAQPNNNDCDTRAFGFATSLSHYVYFFELLMDRNGKLYTGVG